MSKLKNSLKISTISKAEVCADIVLYMFGNRRDYVSPFSEISKDKDNWNVIDVKVSVLNFTIPDIPYMISEKIGKNRWKFKFSTECPYDTADYTIINRSDLKNGEKILILVVMNWSSLDGSEFWKVFYSRMPTDFLREKLEEK